MRLFSLLNLVLSAKAQTCPAGKRAVQVPSKAKPWTMLDYLYKGLYVEDPKKFTELKRDPNQPVNYELIDRNRKWISQMGHGKEVAKKMMNITNTVPIAPQVMMKLVDDSDYCWVFYPYNSDEDVFNEIYGFATDLADFFRERCVVGTIDMAYPSNMYTFQHLFDDAPMLAVKYANLNQTTLLPYFKQDSFALKNYNDWGFRVTADKFENDFDAALYDIVDRAYETQTDFQKMNSIYMELYRSSKEEAEMINKVKQLLNDYLRLHNETLIKKTNKEKHQTEITYKDEKNVKNLTRTDAFQWFNDNWTGVKEMLGHNKIRIEPRSLPDPTAKFKLIKKEL